MTWQDRFESGFRRIGFMSYVAKSPAASACKAWARPISNPSMVAAEFSDIFCALKGATRRPERLKIRHRAVVRIDLPTWDAVPSTIKDRALIRSQFYRKRVAYCSCVLNSFCGLPCASPTIIAVLVPPANSFAWNNSLWLCFIDIFPNDSTIGGSANAVTECTNLGERSVTAKSCPLG